MNWRAAYYALRAQSRADRQAMFAVGFFVGVAAVIVPLSVLALVWP